jgi:hypothetical protein
VFTNPLPVTVRSIVVPWCPLVGDTDEMAGAGSVTEKHALHEAE